MTGITTALARSHDGRLYAPLAGPDGATWDLDLPRPIALWGVYGVVAGLWPTPDLADLDGPAWLCEVRAFFRRTGKEIVPVKVSQILAGVIPISLGR